MRHVAVGVFITMTGQLGWTPIPTAPGLFSVKWPRCACEQQQKVDAGPGQAAPRTSGRRQVEFLDRGGASQEHRVGLWTPICLKGQGKLQRATVRNTAAKTMDAQ
jgi:hypothetical protein